MSTGKKIFVVAWRGKKLDDLSHDEFVEALQQLARENREMKERLERVDACGIEAQQFVDQWSGTRLRVVVNKDKEEVAMPAVWRSRRAR